MERYEVKPGAGIYSIGFFIYDNLRKKYLEPRYNSRYAAKQFINQRGQETITHVDRNTTPQNSATSVKGVGLEN